MSLYMVCVDGSANAHSAFLTALYEAKAHQGKLLTLSVCEHASFLADMSGTQASNADFELQIEKKYRSLLASYNLRCKDEGVPNVSVLCTSSKIGPFICEMANKYMVDVIVLGRSGIGSTMRLLIGSVSSYVMEHAKCNVLVVRGTAMEEVHDPASMVSRLEEMERRRRMRHRSVQVEHDATLAQVVEAEEKERERRIAQLRKQRGSLALPVSPTSADAATTTAAAAAAAAAAPSSGTLADQFRRRLNENITQIAQKHRQDQEESWTSKTRALFDQLSISVENASAFEEAQDVNYEMDDMADILF